MLFCFNAHGMDAKGIEIWQKESKILSHALYNEFMKYIVDSENFSPVTEKKGEINYNVSEEEYSRVDMRKLMKIFPIGILNSFAALVADVPVFLAKKIIQMIKVVTSRDMYEFDLISNLILWHVLEHADKIKEEDWGKEFIKMETDAYAEELGLNPCSDEIIIAKEMYAKIFKNLYCIYKAEKNGDIKIFFINTRFKLLVDTEIKDAIKLLCEEHKGYEEIIDSFVGTNMQPLFYQLNVYSENHKKENVIEFIEAEEEEMYKSQFPLSGDTKKIIDFPLAATFSI